MPAAPAAVWEILREAGIDPAPGRAATTWAQFLRSQAQALLAVDFIETVTLTGARAQRRPCSPHERDHGTGVRTCRRELLDRTLIWNQRHLLHALREYDVFYNAHRPHQGLANARPLTALPEPITDPGRLAHLNIHRRDRLGGILPDYEQAA